MTNQTKNESTKVLPNPQNEEEARTLVCTEAQFNRSYLSVINATGKKLRLLVQEAAIMALLRAYAHDNYDYVNKLYAVVETAMSPTNAKQLRVWLEKYSPCTLRKVENGYSFRKDTSDSANPFDFLAAHENPWYEVAMLTHAEVQALLSGASLKTRIENMIKKVEKDIEQEKVEPNDLPVIQSTLESLKSIALVAANNDTVTNETEEENEEGEAIAA